MKAFPKVLYVKYEKDGEDSYYIASEDPMDFAEIGNKVRVSVYDLHQVVTVAPRVEVA